MIGETRYARSGDVSIAYQVAGSEPLDLLVVPGIVSHVEFMHELPGYTAFLTALTGIARVITFDKRGNGLSDAVHAPPSLEERMDDARAVLDAVGSEKAVLLGVSEGAPLALLFAATYPERTRALALFGGFARMLSGPGFKAGIDRDAYARVVASTVGAWGTGQPLITLFGLASGDDSSIVPRAARCERLSATPTMLQRLWTMNSSIDVRHVLAQIASPTLVLHRLDDAIVPIRAGRFLARKIPGARLVELDGNAHFPFVGETARTLAELRELVGIAPPPPKKAAKKRARVTRRIEADASTITQATRGSVERGLARLLELEEDDRPIEVGRFVVERLLGRGGMGSIYLARDRDLNRHVALKLLRVPDVEALRRFRQEALAVARLSHPNVVGIFELGLDAVVPYTVMEYVPGGTVADLLAHPVPWQRATRIVIGVARGLGAAHALGIVHRDVKPANLLLLERAGDAVKVADFGIAKLADAVEPMTMQGIVVGTIGYMSPEQARGDVVDARTDVYALAVTWYRLLTGKKPFDGSTRLAGLDRNLPDPREIVPSIPPMIARLIPRCGALSADDRPSDGNRVVEEIEAALAY